MLYPDLIWTGLVSIGGFLLLVGHTKDLNKRNWAGIWLAFIGFLIQVYWELVTQPTGLKIFGLNALVVDITIIVLADVLLLIWPGWYLKWLHKRWLSKNRIDRSNSN